MASSAQLSLYPQNAAERDPWIVARRGAREGVDPERPYAFLLETERSAEGDLADVATVFLTNRECPWRCAMCDLWRHTLAANTPVDAIPRQIRYALDRLGEAQQIKLYNSGSFFDPRAIPPEDDAAIAHEVRAFRRVIVESHPVLVGERCFRFAERLQGALEVAMGLETAHPRALELLNKRMTTEQYAAAAARLAAHGIALRSFVLVGTPFVAPEEAALWVQRSIAFAFTCGATAVSLIAVRAGNGAVEALAAAGDFQQPTMSALEDALDFGVSLRRGRVFADLWDVARLASCALCAAKRIERLARVNISQTLEPRVSCAGCEVAA